MDYVRTITGNKTMDKATAKLKNAVKQIEKVIEEMEVTTPPERRWKGVSHH